MAIIAHIEENEPSPVALSKHSCPLCSYEWWELTDAGDYPYYCPGCGEPYSPRDSEVYAEAHGQETVKRELETEDDTMGDAPKASVEKAIAIIAKHCAETECDHCPYSCSMPQWGRYLCMFQNIQPCDWKSCESADE